MPEGGEEIGGGGFAFEGFGAAAEGGTFRDDELAGAHIPEQLGLIANLNRIRGGDVAVHFAMQDHLSRGYIPFDDCLRTDQEDSTRYDFALEYPVKLKVSLKSEGALKFYLIRDNSPIPAGAAFGLGA